METRLLLAVAAMTLAMAGGAAQAECLSAPMPDPFEGSTVIAVGDGAPVLASNVIDEDRRGRVVAPVFVNGEGPFRFIVDTGANRSVLSPNLAQQLGLLAYGEGPVHTVHGETVAPFVGVHSLRFGQLSLPGDEMPLLGGAVLSGEEGLLGVDGLRESRLRLDFENECIEIVASQGANPLRGWTRLDGEIRFGHLLMVRGVIRGVEVNVLIDTGSDSTLANRALSDALRARLSHPIRGADEFRRAYTAGEAIVLDSAMIIPRLYLGTLDVNNLVAYVGDFHVFELWGLQNEPTLLIGMDVLSRTRAVAFDYGRSAVYFRVESRRSLSRDIGNSSRIEFLGSSAMN